jgi:hypothetical protein
MSDKCFRVFKTESQATFRSLSVTIVAILGEGDPNSLLVNQISYGREKPWTQLQAMKTTSAEGINPRVKNGHREDLNAAFRSRLYGSLAPRFGPNSPRHPTPAYFSDSL